MGEVWDTGTRVRGYGDRQRGGVGSRHKESAELRTVAEVGLQMGDVKGEM